MSRLVPIFLALLLGASVVPRPAAVQAQESQDTLVGQLFRAVLDRDVAAVRSAVQAGADINASYAEAFPRGASPLGMAAFIGSESVAEALIELGADLERADDRGNTALTWAILGKHVALARMLLSSGASTEALDEEVMAIWKSFAENEENTEMIELLDQIGVRSLREQGEEEAAAREARLAGLPKIEGPGSYPQGTYGGPCSIGGEDNAVAGGSGWSLLIHTTFFPPWVNVDSSIASVESEFDGSFPFHISSHRYAQGSVVPPECEPFLLTVGDWVVVTQTIRQDWKWQYNQRVNPDGCRPGVICFIKKDTTVTSVNFGTTEFTIGGDECSGGVGTVTHREGAIRVRRDGQWVRVRKGDQIAVGETVQTVGKSRVEISLPDGSTVRLSPSSEIQLPASAHRCSPVSGSPRPFSLKVFLGKVWAKVTSATGGDTKYEVSFGEAVLGVRGTTFLMEVRDNPTDVSLVGVCEGEVDVWNTTGSVRDTVVVGAGQMTSVVAGAVPEEPSAFDCTPGWMEWERLGAPLLGPPSGGSN